MARKPPFSDSSFLAHIFGPKRNPQPSGIRKRTLVGVKNRSKGRLAAFNRMNPVSQQILKMAGLQEQYLRGETSLADAKRHLRPEAIRLGVARPLHVKRRGGPILTPLDMQVATYLKRLLRGEGKYVVDEHVDENVRLIPVVGADYNDTLDWDYSKVKHAGRKDSEYEVWIDGMKRNPYWYH